MPSLRKSNKQSDCYRAWLHGAIGESHTCTNTRLGVRDDVSVAACVMVNTQECSRARTTEEVHQPRLRS